MLSGQRRRNLFHELNEELRLKGVSGEIGLCGGAVMCLVFDARSSTKDVDAIFEPTKEIREACTLLAKRNDLPEDWLYDAAKAYFTENIPQETYMSLSHLRIWAPSAEYMLAMKSISARFDTSDSYDIVFLLNHLGLSSSEKVFEIIRAYYPKELIPPKTKFLIEEILTP